MIATEPLPGSDTVMALPFARARESTFQPRGLKRANVLSFAVYFSMAGGLFAGAEIASGERSGVANPKAIRTERILVDISHLHGLPPFPSARL